MFVRTGVQPGGPLAEQEQENHIWISDQFLVSTKDFQRMVVHGNSIGATPQFETHRICVDSGTNDLGTSPPPS